MNDLVLAYLLITVLVFLLSVLSIDWQGTNPKTSATIALTCWAWPLWVLYGLLWVTLFLLGLAIGLGEEKPPRDESHQLLSKKDMARMRKASPEMWEWHMDRRRHLGLRQ